MQLIPFIEEGGFCRTQSCKKPVLCLAHCMITAGLAAQEADRTILASEYSVSLAASGGDKDPCTEVRTKSPKSLG